MKTMILLFIGAFVSISAGKAQSTSLDGASKKFIVKASIVGLQEISTGKMASEKAVDPDIKAFGNLMATEHSKTQDKLMKLAKDKGYHIAAAELEAWADPKLDNTSGQGFDRAYIRIMAHYDQSALELFQKYAVSGKDADLKAFARKAFPLVKHHLASIVAIDNKIQGIAAR